ncbi:PREDICTED: uncharacterized protein LOC107358697 [Acropora digitifera]|uniref:uncharacterized protein LOC107358697 n=1 Tax=Acropora digitifera TaxID=70779 RepID=UPI00077A475A|nr:PREDICTED: uncharacterized protein LOC107358697 [Acropora digitifera]
MNLVKKKTGQSNSGFIYANQSKGKPIKLMPVSQPQTGSSSVSSSTLKKRSQVIEKFVESVASATQAADDVIHKTATSIKRNKNQFLKSFSEGGLNIIQSITLKQVAELKAHMPMEMLRMIKRTFRDALGYDIFGPEKEIREHLKSMEFEYECGNFESSNGKKVSFVRVANVSSISLVAQQDIELIDSLNLSNNP